jgi:hypothetical protein
MKSRTISSSPWTTASFGGTADTSPMELSALGDHLDDCRKTHSRWFLLRSLGDGLHQFTASRMVTTLFVATVLMGVIALML